MALVHARAGEKVRLWRPGMAASDEKTAALVKTDRFEAVRLSMSSGSRIAPHAVGGYLTLQCLEGAVMLELEHDQQLQAGDWIFLDRGVSHALRALEDSVLLLTILFDD